jgi:hypothetical protein
MFAKTSGEHQISAVKKFQRVVRTIIYNIKNSSFSQYIDNLNPDFKIFDFFTNL